MRQLWSRAASGALGLCAAVAMLTSCQKGTSSVTEPQSVPLPASVHVAPDVDWLGAYDLTLSGGTEAEARLIPARGVTAIGDTFNEVGLSGALNGDLCDCFDVIALELVTPTRVRATFRARHPFLPEFRPDLHAFNLKAHVATDQTELIGSERLAPGIVANADGYSPLWVDQVPGADATLLPYVILSRDTTSAPFDFQTPAGWNVFAVGQSYESSIDFELGSASAIQVRLYLTVDYGQSAVRATRQTPAYELPKFAGKAPWRVEVTEVANDLSAGEPSSTATYRVSVWDWAHNAGTGSDITGGTISIPGIGATVGLPTFSGTGLDPDPLIAETIVTNVAAAPAGEYWGLVQVTDGATDGVALADDLTTLLSRSDYSTWQVFAVQVEAQSLPPTAVIGEPCATQAIIQDRMYAFNGVGSTDDVDPPGNLTYEWDFSYDGSTFNVEATGIATTASFAALGAVDVALRVTDSDTQSDIAIRSLTVIAPTWRNLRNVTNTAASESMDNQGGMCEQRVFIDSTGEAHVIYRNPSGIVTVGHLGSACVPSNTATPLGFSGSPSAQQQGDRLHLAYISGATIEYRTFDLLPRTLGAAEVAMTAASLPPPVASSFNSCRLARDPDTGHLFVIGESSFSNFDLYSAERTASSGPWTAPILADNRTTTSFSAFMDAAVSEGQCIVAYMDGSGTARTAYYLRKAAGAASWPARSLMGLPTGPHLCFWLVDGPGEDLLGSFFNNPSGTGAIAYYLRWNASTDTWSAAQIGNLSQYNFFANVCLNPLTNEVTVVWEHIQVSGSTPRRILAKRFPYDAGPAVIGNGVFEVVSEVAGLDSNEPAAAFNPVTQEVIAVWERDMDPTATYAADLWTAEY